MRARQTTNHDSLDLSDSRRPVEVVGQARGVQMRPPDEGDVGGEFQIMLENGDTVTSPYPAEWHLDVAGSLQANDVVLAEVRGFGDSAPKGKLWRIRQIESFNTRWSAKPKDGEKVSFTVLKFGNDE